MAVNIADLVAEAAHAVPDHPAIVDLAGGLSLNWRGLDAAVTAYALALVDAGVRPGDRVAIALPNSAAFAVGVFAILRAGAVVVPIGTDWAPREVARVIEHSGAALLVGPVDPAGARTAPEPVLVVEPGEPGVEPLASVGGGEDLAVLNYTSGTAGQPRGAMLSHRALLANVAQCAALKPAPVTTTDRVLLAVPMSHSYGLGPGLLQVAGAKATAVLLDKFGVERTLDACRDHRITAMVGVPAMYQALGAVDQDRLGEALASMRLLTSGAAPLEAGTLARFRQATGLNIFEGYGLTETGPVLTSTLVGGFAKPGSVGRPIPGVELRLVDSAGFPVEPTRDQDEFVEELTDDDTGLVSVRGDNLFSGYWPDGAHGPDGEGWFRTGDVGYLDVDGDLCLVDRAGDLIIVNGFNVYPHEVEQVVAELAEVAEVAAFGIPDERTGERVKVAVVLRDGAELTEESLLTHCAERLARFKVPGVVEFVAGLPHSVTGKLRRASLRGKLSA